MATIYSNEWTGAFIDEPITRVEADKWHGRKRILMAEVDLAAEFAVSDIAKLFKLPAGARIVDARFVGPASGATGQYALGWAAGADGDEAADADGLFAGATLDTGNAAVDAKLAGTAAGFLKRFSEEVDIQLSGVEVTASATGDTLKVIVEYVND